jgi:hypothetical protein
MHRQGLGRIKPARSAASLGRGVFISTGWGI